MFKNLHASKSITNDEELMSLLSAGAACFIFLPTTALSTIEPTILINTVRLFEISLTDTLLKNKTRNYNTIHGNSNI
jgi:hypothetical protein